MSPKRIHRKIEMTAREKKRIDDVRRHFQDTLPTPEELLASSEVAKFVPLGEYLDSQKDSSKSVFFPQQDDSHDDNP